MRDAPLASPRRPWTVWTAAAFLYAAVATVVAGLLWASWQSIHSFADSAWLNGVVPTEPGAGLRVLMVTALYAITIVVGAAALITGYYGWQGFGWTRWSALVALAVSFLALMINPLASWGIAGVAAGVVLLWLPATTRYHRDAHAWRHPTAEPAAVMGEVTYGPLPRYR